MQFWHMDDGDGLPAVTLCDDHALEGTNMAMMLSGQQPFESMTEAVTMFEAAFAAAGSEDPAPILEHEGPCDQCEWDAKHGTPLEETA